MDEPRSKRRTTGPNVREIVRVAENSHGAHSSKRRDVPILWGFSAGAARGIRTPDPVITKGKFYALLRFTPVHANAPKCPRERHLNVKQEFWQEVQERTRMDASELSGIGETATAQ